MAWNYTFIGIPYTDHRLGHVAIQVALPDGYTFYLDDGWWSKYYHMTLQSKPAAWYTYLYLSSQMYGPFQ